MCDEELKIGGALMYRDSPTGKWTLVFSEEVRYEVITLRKMTDEDRRRVSSNFCVHCGTDDPRCQCRNHE